MFGVVGLNSEILCPGAAPVLLPQRRGRPRLGSLGEGQSSAADAVLFVGSSCHGLVVGEQKLPRRARVTLIAEFRGK